MRKNCKMSIQDLKPFEQKIWLSSPTMHGEEQAFVKEAFDTNWVSTVGKNIDELERGICEYTGAKYAVGLSAGTAALHLAVKLAGVQPGDKVFCSDMTFAATLNPVVYEGGEPVFIDTSYDDWNMDPEALKKAFEKYTDVKVVVVANLYGTPARLKEIRKICDDHGAILIEDAAESLGATLDGQQTGTFGTYNAISFNGNKIITTSGGGMLLSDDEEAIKLAKKWSTQSREPAPWYQHIQTGYNYRLSNILAGIGRGQLLHLEEHIAQKKAIYERYREGFKDIPISMNPIPENVQSNYWLSCMLIDKKAMCPQTRTDLVASFEKKAEKTCPTEILELLSSYNAEGRPIWKPMHMQPIFKESDFIQVDEAIDVSADIFERGLCLPSDNKTTPEQQDIIIELVRSCF